MILLDKWDPLQHLQGEMNYLGVFKEISSDYSSKERPDMSKTSERSTKFESLHLLLNHCLLKTLSLFL